MYSGTRREAVVSDRGKAFVTATDQALGLHRNKCHHHCPVAHRARQACDAAHVRATRNKHDSDDDKNGNDNDDDDDKK